MEISKSSVIKINHIQFNIFLKKLMQKVGSELMQKLSRLLKMESDPVLIKLTSLLPPTLPCTGGSLFFWRKPLTLRPGCWSWTPMVCGWRGFLVAVSRAPAAWLQRTTLWLGIARAILRGRWWGIGEHGAWWPSLTQLTHFSFRKSGWIGKDVQSYGPLEYYISAICLWGERYPSGF